MNLLDLEYDQNILIEKGEYRILNKVKFSEKSSYWIEYKLRNENSEIFYLNIEISRRSDIL